MKFILVERVNKKGPLFILPWRCTFACDNNCLHCASASKSEAENELDTKEAIKLVDQIKNFGANWVGFSGGEPLLRTDLFDIIIYIKKVGLKASIITDGHLLNSKAYEKTLKNEKEII